MLKFCMLSSHFYDGSCSEIVTRLLLDRQNVMRKMHLFAGAVLVSLGGSVADHLQKFASLVLRQLVKGVDVLKLTA